MEPAITDGSQKTVNADPKGDILHRGYLRPREGYRRFEQRETLCRQLKDAVRENGDWLRQTLRYPLPELSLRS